MGKPDIEVLFEWLDETTKMIQQHEDEPYLESLVVTMETAFYEEVADNIDDILTHKLKAALKDISFSTFNSEDIHKAIQLCIIKGMKDSTQPNHLMTPETVGLFIGYLAGKLSKDMPSVRLFDPVAGTGNLLMITKGQLEQTVHTFASEVDPTLTKVALMRANLQKEDVEFFHQDSLAPFLLDPVDLVVADLPVGYYPDDVRASEFELEAKKGHSYAHHLLIEQSIRYTKEAGYLIFVVPGFLFDSEQSDQLLSYIQEQAHIIGILQLPESVFKSDKDIKSILILQKKGENTTDLKQPLLVDLPSFKDTAATADILDQMNAWFEEHLYKKE